MVRWPTGTLPLTQETSTRTRPHGNLAVHSIDRCRVTFTSRRIHPPLLSSLSPQMFNFESETKLSLQGHERACGLDCSPGHCLDDRCFTLGVKNNYIPRPLDSSTVSVFPFLLIEWLSPVIWVMGVDAVIRTLIGVLFFWNLKILIFEVFVIWKCIKIIF